MCRCRHRVRSVRFLAGARSTAAVTLRAFGPFRDWLSMLFSEAPGEPSIRRVVFAVVFAAAVLLWFIGIFKEIPVNVWDMAKTTVYAASGVMGAGRFAEALERRP